jgi:hypothetical protein
MKLAKCKCGSMTFIREVRVTGTWTSLLTLNEDGTFTTEGCGDSRRNSTEPKTVRCAECFKRQPNPCR